MKFRTELNAFIMSLGRAAISTAKCVLPDLRQWKTDLQITIEAGPRLIGRGKLRRLSHHLDHSLLEQAHSVRKLKKAIGFILIFIVVILITQIYVHSDDDRSFDVATAAFLGFCLATLCWRLAVARAASLAIIIHQWALETQEDPSIWVAHPADASAIFAPWIPRGSMVIVSSWKKLKRRLR